MPRWNKGRLPKRSTEHVGHSSYRSLNKQIQGNQDLLHHFTTARGRRVEFNKTLSNKTAGEEKP